MAVRLNEAIVHQSETREKLGERGTNKNRTVLDTLTEVRVATGVGGSNVARWAKREAGMGPMFSPGPWGIAGVPWSADRVAFIISFVRGPPAVGDTSMVRSRYAVSNG